MQENKATFFLHMLLHENCLDLGTGSFVDCKGYVLSAYVTEANGNSLVMILCQPAEEQRGEFFSHGRVHILSLS